MIYKRYIKGFTLVIAGLALLSKASADYPIVSHRYLADPSVLVTEDRVYVYCSNDDLSPLEGGYNIPNVVCVSSSDMKNWTDHGVVFDAERDTSWSKKTWAPCAIERDGKFYIYFGNSGANIGVVEGESPVGPFKDVLGGPLITHGTPGVQPAKNMWLFDPGVFIDNDGQAYIYFGGNGDDNVRAAKLNEDMVSLDGDVIKMHAPNFFEAAWVWRIEDTYYFSYSTTPRAEMRIDYMTSDHPTEGFEYAGIVGAQPPLNNNNNHAAQFLFKGNWYHVYHNRIVATEAGIPTGFRRNIAVEEFGYDDEGNIIEVEYTRDGVEQIGSLDPYVRVEAETFAEQSGIETEPSSAGGMKVTDTQNGDWFKVAGVDFGEAGASKVSVMASAASKGSRIEMRLDSPDGELIADIAVQPTGGEGKWKASKAKVSGAQGVHDLYISFVGDGDVADLDWWQFSPKK
ncbi:glycoside hydrolase family 43 protein [Pelagicoccus sp. SDUM812003]|uniref:glycoside hydrolase family 43 protein n=1 Tax=Pelagicoccus sp. SDUM812003 TaxID=3041267 RepID=UPI00280D9C8A|nr:glycoside hydrolase family 43 protein [Pelagicoccus sp. SDUM812003]MDQ8203499.1 glycoside hydrolase family 43 protein [Pelagicoccus sp. SDUM812003]